MSGRAPSAPNGGMPQARGIEPDAGEIGPVRPEDRVKLIDVLRGFALLGILVVNWNWASGTSADWITFVAEGSFYPMFSFLFGLGFALQLMRAERAHRPFVARYVWRSALLLGIGVFHAGFISSGDILRPYAILAIVLLVVRRWHPRVLVAMAAVFLLFAASPTSEYLRPGRFLMRPDPEQAGLERARELADHWERRAQVAGIVGSVPALPREYREQLTRMIPAALTTFAWPLRPNWWRGVGDILCMFLLGLWAGRRRILEDPHTHTRLLVAIGVVGLLVGVLGNGVDTFRDTFQSIGVSVPTALQPWALAYELGNIGLTAFYLAILTLLYTRVPWAARVLALLGWAGRVALTNYLLQSVMFDVVFPYGFGDLPVLLGFFGLQVLCSGLWLKWFRFGPVEWFWRSLTWWRWQPMRRSPAPAV